ncbi:TPA: DUF4393 domain-containing protein [Vibrio parahaemolyticus]|nr:DUF4393 domain-containing protein [Vibrio parahaemolyticus]
MIPEVLSAVSSEKGLLTQIYTDLAKPGVSQVGAALGSVLGLGNTLLIPITLLNEKGRCVLQKNMESYKEQLKHETQDRIAEVPPEVGVPVLEKLTYVTNAEISELYVNLLAKASTHQSNDLAHPAFTRVIDSLSPDEAKILKALYLKNSVPFVDFIISNQDGTYRTLSMSVTNIPDIVELQNAGNIRAYLSNLESLGILNARRDIWSTDDSVYEQLDASYRPPGVTLDSGQKQNYNKGIFEITDFGKLFIIACCRKLNT